MSKKTVSKKGLCGS